MAGKRGITIQIQGDGESAKRALEMVREQMAETAEKGEETSHVLSESMERIKHSLEYVGIYMGIREAIDGIKEMIGGSVELAEEIGHLSQQTGISAQNLSVMKYMADKTGVGFDTLTKSFRVFSQQILDADEGQKTAVQNFNRLGISQQEVKKNGNDMLGMLGMVADRFRTLPDGPQKAAEAIRLFGRSGMAIVPILNQGRSGIMELAGEAQSLGLVLDESGIQKMEELHQATVKMQGALKGAEMGMTAGMEPALENLETAVTSLVTGGQGVVSWGQQLGNVMLGAANTIAYVIQFVRQAKDEWVALGAVGNAVDAKLDSWFDVGSGARARARQAYTDAAAAEKAALKDRADAEADYQKFANNLAKGLTMGDGTDGAVTLPNGNLATRRRAGTGGEGSMTPQPQGTTGHVHSDDAFLTAANALQQQQIETASEMQKAGDAEMLADIEAQHKMMLVSDQEFYREKLALQTDSLDAEENALKQRIAELQQLQAKQHGDKTLKRDKSGTSAEEQRTQADILRLQKEVDDLQGRRAALTSAATAEIYASNQQQQLAGLRAAAELEKERGTQITAQVALLREEAAIKAKGFTANGDAEGASDVMAMEQIAEKKLQIEQINKQIADSEESNKLAVDAYNDAVAKGRMSKGAAEKQINALNKQEAETLKTLIAEYTALANELGGDFAQKAKALQAELNKLNTPGEKGPSQMAKELGSGFGSMIEQLANDAARGKTSVHEMALSMERDLMDLAIKMATQRWLTPALQGLFTGGGGGGGGSAASTGLGDMGGLPMFADGGDPTGPSIVGEKGPELFVPKGPGTVISNSTLQKVASSGGHGSPNITTNIINQSSSPVTARPSEVGYDAQLKQYVINTVLEDHANGGPTSAIGRQAS